MKEQGISHTQIAGCLRRDQRTVQRKLFWNANSIGAYKPAYAQRQSWARRLRCSKIKRCSHLHETGTSCLAMGWTPEQISGRLQLEQSASVVSHEPIYRSIYSQAGRHQKLSRYLPHHHAKRGYRRRKEECKKPIRDRVPIDQRPQEANERNQIGHWEADLVHFSLKSDILLTLQERRSHYWPCPLTSATRTAHGNAGQSKTAMSDYASICPGKQNFPITPTRIFRIWLCFTTTHHENALAIKHQSKLS